MNKILLLCPLTVIFILPFIACTKEVPEDDIKPVTYNPGYNDDYSSISGIENSGLWGPYNLHDPTIIKYNNEYFIFSTDVMYGGSARAGVMRRKSDDLVKWFFRGWVFDDIPSEALSHLTNLGHSAGTIWAPYAQQVGDEIRLYYSVSVFGQNISAIGMATSESPYGPWEDKGVVLSTTSESPVNAIDPTVIIDAATGRHWMAYGSYWSGIYTVELNATTGKRLMSHDLGKRIAARTDFGQAIEGPELLYNSELNKYFLFVTYDWLEDSYNVRVGRSDYPDGPFLDFFGNDMADAGENFPVITAQYSFNNHSGWQGFGHCGILSDSGNYYYVSQARPSSNIYLMNLHIRRVLWLDEGWPVIAPERYVNVPQNQNTADTLIGVWEFIYLKNTHSKNRSSEIAFLPNGRVNGFDNASWKFTDNQLEVDIPGDKMSFIAKVSDEWDWENNRLTVCFSGLSMEGITVWGKKIE